MGPVDMRQGVCVTCSVFPPNSSSPATPLWCLSLRCDDGSHVFPASPSLSTYTERKCTAGTKHLARMQGEPGAISWTGTVVEDWGPEAIQTVICTWSRMVSRKKHVPKKRLRKDEGHHGSEELPWSTRVQSSATTCLRGLLLQPRGDSASSSSRGEM